MHNGTGRSSCSIRYSTSGGAFSFFIDKNNSKFVSCIARAAREQLQMLDLFQGSQPDYHMNEAAIRHWDGYWFGKRKCLGDTYPHYWSALSGYAYAAAAAYGVTGDYAKKAECTLRAVLSLFGEDGTASCAMVYPMYVNGAPAAFYDPWANDQDWGLYYALKFLPVSPE